MEALERGFLALGIGLLVGIWHAAYATIESRENTKFQIDRVVLPSRTHLRARQTRLRSTGSRRGARCSTRMR